MSDADKVIIEDLQAEVSRWKNTAFCLQNDKSGLELIIKNMVNRFAECGIVY